MIFDQNKYTDWQDVLFGKTSSNSDFHGSLSGGTENNTFLVSAGFTKSNFNFPGAGYSDQRMTLHSALHHNSSDNKLSMDLIMDYGYDRSNQPGGGANNILLAPNLPDLLDAQGNLVWQYMGVDLSNSQFYSYLKKSSLLNNYNLNNTLRLAYKIVPGLSFSVNMGYSRNNSIENFKNPAAAQNPAYANSASQFGNLTSQSINLEPQIDYTYAWGKGILTALLGGTYKKRLTNSSTVSGNNYANDFFLGSINGAGSISSNDVGDVYKYSAGFARLKYVYDEKYILSLTGRRDGSSNFGPRNQFGNFGSVGAGWIFSEEKGFKTILPFISFAKLSGSYGTSGSDGVSSFQYQTFWQPVGFVPAFQGIKPNIPLNLYNPDYSWALKKSLNISLDFGFFHDRLLLTTNYYRNREGNQLGGYPLAAQAGFPTVLQNLPAEVQNKGWEFSLNSTNIRTKNFNWSTNFNISFNRNKLLSFPNLESSSFSSNYVIGEPTSIVIGYKFKGLNPATGLFEYYDKNGNATNSPQYGLASSGGDQAPIANQEVKYMGGMGNNFSYKGFSLSVFFQFSSQTAPNYLATIYQSYLPGVSVNNLPLAALDYWKKPGDQTTLQKLSASYSSEATNAANSFGASSAAYSDDTYLRLKTMSLSYSLPDTWLKKAYVRNCRIFINAQNLLTITNYKVGDPEQFGFTGVPLQRTVAFGLNFNL
ncbi:TonB dependent receptor [compost metagenome]